MIFKIFTHFDICLKIQQSFEDFDMEIPDQTFLKRCELEDPTYAKLLENVLNEM